MRPDALRPATRKAAEGSRGKLASRLSKGEKRGRKRMAEIGAVETPAEISPAATTNSAGEQAVARPCCPASRSAGVIDAVFAALRLPSLRRRPNQ